MKPRGMIVFCKRHGTTAESAACMDACNRICRGEPGAWAHEFSPPPNLHAPNAGSDPHLI